MLNKMFQNNDLAQKLLTRISRYKDDIRIMEVCGSHTMAIGKWALRKLLPPNIHLISGPGCPVCVTPPSIIDSLIDLRSVTIATFGDMLRLPGNNGTLEDARAAGLDVRIVYSPLDALKLAKENETIFIGIGFETTIPGIAHTIRLASQKNLTSLSVLPAFKIIPPALKALLNSSEVNIDGFILPGNVSAIIGSNAYEFLPQEFNLGGVVTGFEPLDILTAINMLIDQQQNNSPKIENEYQRVVSPAGNINAQQAINEVLQVQDSWWRGLGYIPASGLGIREKFRDFDAIYKYNLNITDQEKDTGCQCGDVLKGIITPPQCPLFATKCTPANPIGPCMVSSEGSCAAYYKYEFAVKTLLYKFER